MCDEASVSANSKVLWEKVLEIVFEPLPGNLEACGLFLVISDRLPRDSAVAKTMRFFVAFGLLFMLDATPFDRRLGGKHHFAGW